MRPVAFQRVCEKSGPPLWCRLLVVQAFSLPSELARPMRPGCSQAAAATHLRSDGRTTKYRFSHAFSDPRGCMRSPWGKGTVLISQQALKISVYRVPEPGLGPGEQGTVPELRPTLLSCGDRVFLGRCDP